MKCRWHLAHLKSGLRNGRDAYPVNGCPTPDDLSGDELLKNATMVCLKDQPCGRLIVLKMNCPAGNYWPRNADEDLSRNPVLPTTN